jgi:hypothetical protein
MSNFTALEVVIGLAFVYFVLALVCSAVAEAISSLQRKRAKMLVAGIENLLSGSDTITEDGRKLAKQFWNHPLIQGLIRPRGSAVEADKASHSDGKGPAYVPARTFVSALIDLGARNSKRAKDAEEEQTDAKEKPADSAEKPSDLDEKLTDIVMEASLVDAIKGIPSAPLRKALLAIYKDADGELQAFRRGAEEWYDDAMDRVSGWYKRHIQFVLWVIAILVVLFLNVDTVQIATTLWKDPTTRAAVVARADKAVQQGKGSVDVSKIVRSIELPLGWKLKFGRGKQEIPDHTSSVIAKLIGLFLTAAALSLGAPFWFDLLSKFVSVRGTGPPPVRATDQPAT